VQLLRRMLVAAGVAACIGVWAVGPSGAKDPLPAGAAAAQLEADIKYLQAGLAAKKKNAVTPLKSTAMLLALNAQNQLDGKDGAQMAGVRDQAVKVAAALGKADPDWDAAAKEAATLGTATGDPKKVVKLHEQNEFDVHDLMTVFKPKNRGGRGLEDDTLKMAKTVADTKAAGELANLVTLIGQYCEAMPPDANKDKWAGYSKDMVKAGAEAAEAAAKGDKAATVKKVQAIDQNCKNCHNVFRK
jgi:hypothetical protein